MDTKEPHLFVPFKEVETWSLTAKFYSTIIS